MYVLKLEGSLRETMVADVYLSGAPADSWNGSFVSAGCSFLENNAL